MKARHKKYIDKTVYQAALERIEYLYQRFDHVVVSFSGGKDSTAVLNLTVEVATRLGRLPVWAIFVDEEAIHPPTVEYVERVRQRTDVKLDWYCLPVKHRNACSNEQPWWYCWNPAERHLWVRELPPWGITEHPLFRFGDSFAEWMPKIFPESMGSVVVVTGIRTQESLRRYRVIAQKKNDAYITSSAEYGNSYRAHPIYDWSSEDVWKLVEVKELDYNRTYDVFNRTELYNKLLTQRVCPPYGEEPLRGLWVYAECWPELWHKMVRRVKGVGTAWRYANTELYSNWDKPDGVSWKQYAEMVIDTYTEPEYRNAIRESINGLIAYHYTKTNEPIEDEQAHILTGACWKFFAKIAVKGDFKGRQKQNMVGLADQLMKRRGLTLEQVQAKHGKASDRQGAVGTAFDVEAERLQPQRGGAAGAETAAAVHHRGRVDAADSGEPGRHDSGRIPSLDGVGRPGHQRRAGGGAGQEVEARPADRDGEAQPRPRDARGVEDGRNRRRDGRGGRSARADMQAAGDGAGGSGSPVEPEGDSQNQDSDTVGMVEGMGT